MNSRVILFIGFLLSIMYIFVAIHLNTPQKVLNNNIFRFAFLLKDNKIELVAKLPIKQKNSSIQLIMKDLCEKYQCKKNIKYFSSIKQKNYESLLTELLNFIDKKSLTKASIIVADDSLDINFLVSDANCLKDIKKIYSKYKNLNIKDSSSVLRYFDIASLQKEINLLLKDKNISFNRDDLTDNSKDLLKKVCNRLKSLGNISLILYLDISPQKIEIVQNYIKSFSWIKEVSIKIRKTNKIKIKEVLR